MMPERNSMDEMCPSPVARRLMMKRSAALGHAALIRMRHDGGIEQRGGFQRILAGEQRADEQLPLAGERPLGEDVRPHFLDSAASRSASMSKCRESNS